MKSVILGVIGVVLAYSVSLSAQWPKYPASDASRDSQGRVVMDAPPEDAGREARPLRQLDQG
jgi:hypothetical protein